jgi:septum formation protein
MYQIVLASKSPRRIELLKEIGLKFITFTPDFEEQTRAKRVSEPKQPSKELALFNAIGKAQSAAKHFKNSIIIGVDTVGESHGHILGKPKDREDAKRLIRLISGTTHKVVSAVCLVNTVSGKTISATSETLVTMDKMEEKEIEAYVESGEGDDKAAAYAIQGKGALFIKRIEGDYFNVVGLPIYTLKKLLKEFEIDIT